MHITRTLVFWSLVSLLALNGCGGGGGGDTNSSSTPVTGNAIKKGVAVDPYVVGAVFHEVAADGVTILQQQSTSSDTNGVFSFPNPLTPGSTVEMKVSSKGLHGGVPFQGLLRRTIKADDVLTVTVSPLTTLLANGIPPNDAILSLNNAGFIGLTTADLYANPMNGLADLTSGITDQKLKLLQAAMAVEGYMEITGNFHPTISDITNISQTQILDSMAAIMRANLSTSEFARVSTALAGDPQMTGPLTLGDLIMAVTQQQQNLISQIKSDIAANGDFNPTLAGQIGQSIREQTADMVKALFLVRNGNLSSPSIIVTANGSITTNESGLPATFSVRLGSMPTADVTIPVQSSDTTEGTVDKSSLRFTNANWNTDQTVTVTGVSDALVDGNVAYDIILGATISTDSLYNNLNPDDLSATNIDIRTAFFVVSSISGNTSESGIKANFTVRLGSIPAADVTIPVHSSDTSEATVDKSSLTFTTSNWNQDQTVTVTGVSDVLADGPISYSIQLGTTTSNDGIYNALNPPDVTVTNTDVRSASFDIGAISGSTSESGTTATFTVRLGSQPTANVTIPVSSSKPEEGTVAPASLIFTNANWNMDQTVTVTGVSDDLADGDVVYSIVLGNTTSTDSIYNAQNPNDVAVTNTDVRAAASFVINSIIGNTTSESGTTATFTVRLGSQPTANVTIPVSSSKPEEGTMAPASLIFTNANWNMDQTVTVTGVSDDLADGDVVYSIVLGNTTSTDSIYNAQNPNDVAVTNTDVRAAASFVINSIIGNTTSESGTTATFTVRLGSQPTANVTIPVSSSKPEEGTVAPASLIFTNANWSTPQTVTVTGVSDPLADGDVNYNIVLGATSSTDLIYNAVNPNDVAVTNTDVRAAASFVISPISGNTSESGTTATFTVRLASQPTADLTIPVSSDDTSEGTVSPASLTFTNANWNTDQTVTVTGVSDALPDGNVAYSIILGTTTSPDGIYNALNPNDVSVNNLDVRTASFVVSAISNNTTEGLATATFTVRLGSQPTADVTIPVSSSDTSEGTADISSLTFTNANWDTNQIVTVTGVDDPLHDGDIYYTIQLGLTGSIDDIYSGLDPVDIGLTNIDMKTGNFEITPGTTLTTNEAGLTATFRVRLTSQPASDVEIPVTSADTSEGTVDKAKLTFTSGDWGSYQEVTVTGVSDSDDSDISYNIQLGITSSVDDNYNQLNPADVMVTNQNVLAGSFIITVPGDTDESGRQATFTVRLASAPTADVIIPVSSSNTNEGTVAPLTSLTFTPLDYDQDQTVTVTGVDDSIADGNQSYSIILGPTSSAAASYNALDPADVTLSNIDLVDPYGVTPQISAGPYHSLVLASDGSVWGWGPCNSGQIDAAPTTCSGSFAIPQRLNITKASAVSAGYSFSTVVKADGTVWTSGANEYGQLGHTSGPSLAQVDELTGVKAVSSSSYHTLALKNDGSVWAWGNGGFGQLGNGLKVNSQTPVPALGDLAGKTVTAIAVGDLHSVALDNVGKAYSWGSDVSEQLGLGTGDQSTPTPTVISSLTDVSTIAAGQQYSFAVGTYTSPTMVVVTDTYGWGSNNDGQLGVTASAAPKSLPTRVGFFSDLVTPSLLDGGYQHSLALYGSTVYAWGDNDDVNETNEGWDNRGALGNGGISDVTLPAVSFAGASATAVSTGNNHSLVLLSDGRVQSSGRNNTAQLGTNEVDIGPEFYTATPVYVEDPGDSGKGTIKYLYAYRPILSGQPASATTITTATITVCAPVVSAYCQGITYYKYSTNNGITWSTATPIATPITLSGLTAPQTVNLWVKGMSSISNEIQTDNSAVKVSWTVN